MRYFQTLTLACFLFAGSATAQDFDVTKWKADPLTMVFDDGNHTVTGYIYDVLRASTNCCGNDAVYLEVVFDKNGYVIESKTLTGKNECYMKSIVDIVKSIRWDATGVVGKRTTYFDVKPILACAGDADENVYAPVAILNNPVATTSVTEEEEDEFLDEEEESVTAVVKEEIEEKADPVKKEVTAGTEVKTEPAKTEPAKTEPVKAEPVVVKTEVKTPEKSIEVSTTPVKTEPKTEVSTTSTTTPGKLNMEEDDFLSDNPVSAIKTDPVPGKTTAKTPATPGGPNLPVQMDKPYVSTGDKNPDESHKGQFKNYDPNKVESVQYADDESRVAVLIKSALRKQGVCGLAQAAIELLVDPRTGNIIQHRVLGSNTPDIAGKIPGILSNIRFTPQVAVRHNYRTYIHFKTDIVCEGTPKEKIIDLDTVPDMLKTASNE